MHFNLHNHLISYSFFVPDMLLPSYDFSRPTIVFLSLPGHAWLSRPSAVNTRAQLHTGVVCLRPSAREALRGYEKPATTNLGLPNLGTIPLRLDCNSLGPDERYWDILTENDVCRHLPSRTGTFLLHDSSSFLRIRRS